MRLQDRPPKEKASSEGVVLPASTVQALSQGKVLHYNRKITRTGKVSTLNNWSAKFPFLSQYKKTDCVIANLSVSASLSLAVKEGGKWKTNQAVKSLKMICQNALLIYEMNILNIESVYTSGKANLFLTTK